ncbi:hypothetical protein P280DRAFT_464865 [Massarina eburnea CBS 473.64]|uniref:Rhodopsin domain-containing protein n=1 Tax=Massarina eburnea CBS 473.64 TaxID=1395130 RepID=A0A6A6SGK2_9PLEO|nr:hypothetical protein P280DRAFT_464865 [Massarina eburnea CBS 473.64]
MSDSLDASQIPTPVSETAANLAHHFVRTSIALSIIATVLFGVRIYTKTSPVFRLSNDDYVAVVAFVFVNISTGLLLQSVWWVFADIDTSTLTLLDIEYAFMFAIIAEVFWTWAMVFTKISIAVMLLRFEPVLYMRRFLWLIVAFLIIQGMYGMMFQLLQCIPLRTVWDLLHRDEGQCLPQAASIASSVTVQVINICTDWILAMLPISFLRKVQRPTRERVVVGCLMGLGALGGIASIVKIVYLSTYATSSDTLVESIRIGMLSVTEALLVFTAACVPCLRVPFQRALEHLGLVPADGYSDPTYEYNRGATRTSRSVTTNTDTRSSGIRMKALGRSDDNRSDTQVLTGSSGEMDSNLSEIWRTTEFEVQREARALEKIRKGHTPALPHGESCENLEKMHMNHTPALPPIHKRHESWDEEAGEDSGRKGKWWIRK